MRVAFFLNDMCVPGGIQRVAANLARDLQPHCDTRILTVYSCPGTVFADAGVCRDSLGLPFTPDGFFPSGSEMWRIGWRLRQYVVEQRIDILVCFWWHLAIVGALALPRSVVRIGYEHIAYSAAFGHWEGWRRLAYPRLDAIVSLTEEDRPRYEALSQRSLLQRMRRAFRRQSLEAPRVNSGASSEARDRARVRVIPNYVASNLNPRPADQRESILLAVGHVEPRKGLDRLLWALQRPLLSHPGWRLVILGDDSRASHHANYRGRLQMQAALLGLTGRIDLLPSTPAVQQWYQRAAIYVMGSHLEGLPMVLLEAKSHGLPIISFDCPTGPREIVQHGIDGFLAGNDIDAFADAASCLMADPALRRRMGEAALEDARQRFSPERITGMWLDLFEAGLSGRASKIHGAPGRAEGRPFSGTQDESPVTPAPDPFTSVSDRNFGASGHRGTLAILADQNPQAASLWHALGEYIARTQAPHEGMTVLFCMGRRLALGQVPLDRLSPQLVVTQMPGQCEASTLPANLSDYSAMRQIEDCLTAGGCPLRLIVGELLEYLTDPRPLLRLLRRLLKAHPDSRLILGTLDRAALDASGLPESANYMRLWYPSEIQALLASAGFELRSAHPAESGCICECGCSTASYSAFLKSHQLPEPSELLVLMAPDSLAGGGPHLRRALDELIQCTGINPLVLSVDFPEPPANWVRAEALAHWDNAWQTPEGVLEAVKQLVFLYDGLRLIDYPDHGGVFFRVAQAKRAGLLPTDILCQVTCHGSHFHIEQVRKEWQRPDANLTVLWEKLSIELADVVRFPTDHARHLYLDQVGLKPVGRVVTHGLPYGFKTVTQPPQRTIDTLVFLGKRLPGTDWDVFRAVVELIGPLMQGAFKGIQRILLAGSEPEDPSLPVPAGLKVEIHDAEDERPLLRELASSALVVVGLCDSSYPYAVLDVIDAGCQPLVLTGGGAEQLLPPEYRDHFACRPDALLDRLHHSLMQPTEERRRLLQGLTEAMRERQDSINRALAPAARHPADDPSRQEQAAWSASLWSEPSPVTVIVPVYNRPLKEVEDLVIGLNSQILPPREVIFIDDASAEDFAACHGARIKSLLAMPARFIRHTENGGLARARNTGLAAVETEFVAVHDSDNIAAHEFLYHGCRLLRANPQFDAATFLIETFMEGQDWRCFDPTRERYRPIGDGLFASLGKINWLGDAMGVYRTSSLRRLGGWDDSDRSMWEDLALFLKMLGAGQKLMNIPAFDICYRIRPDSMLRTGSEYDARHRLARNTQALSMFDALSLMRQLVRDEPTAVYLNAHGHLVAALKGYLGRLPWAYRMAGVALQLLRRLKRRLAG